MLLSKQTYAAAKIEPERPLIQMSDFNSLIALSQKHKVPIFALSDKQLGHVGTVLENTKKSMKRFFDIYSSGADLIIKILDNA
jgi:hypothetical protein